MKLPSYTTRNAATARRRSRGITLVEMMVALAITTFVILVVNQLFNSVTETVSRGTQVSELLQKARTLDEQLAFETELNVVDPTNAAAWHSRMVGPAGRNGSGPGGFLAIFQRTIPVPLTLEDALKPTSDPTRLTFIRSDQLMFVYDQESPLDAGAKRLPAMAPSSRYSYGGDQRDSDNAEYVRMWYGHALQVPKDFDPTAPNMSTLADYQYFFYGSSDTRNPNIAAQDFVLGRHALFLTDSSGNLAPNTPYGTYTGSLGLLANGGVTGIGLSGSPALANGVCDVANFTLEQITGSGSGLGTAPTLANYQNNVLRMMFTAVPLLTAAKNMGTSGDMSSWDYAPTHTYFMGGVSDIIIEFAGDLVTGHFSSAATATQLVPDGELDRDDDGKIKWYTALQPNPDWVSGYNQNHPITQPAPAPGTVAGQYPPRITIAPSSQYASQAAFVWQQEGSPNFTSWPWMLRIRYRLHDRHGKLEGRQVTNFSTGQTEPEHGVWYETIIPVNYQNIKP